MQKSFPSALVPSLQSFPESGYPIAAYYGVDSTLSDLQVGSASSGGNNAATLSMTPQQKTRMIFTILGVIFVGYALFHWYNK